MGYCNIFSLFFVYRLIGSYTVSNSGTRTSFFRNSHWAIPSEDISTWFQARLFICFIVIKHMMEYPQWVCYNVNSNKARQTAPVSIWGLIAICDELILFLILNCPGWCLYWILRILRRLFIHFISYLCSCICTFLGSSWQTSLLNLGTCCFHPPGRYLWLVIGIGTHYLLQVLVLLSYVFDRLPLPTI